MGNKLFVALMLISGMAFAEQQINFNPQPAPNAFDSMSQGMQSGFQMGMALRQQKIQEQSYAPAPVQYVPQHSEPTLSKVCFDTLSDKTFVDNLDEVGLRKLIANCFQ